MMAGAVPITPRGDGAPSGTGEEAGPARARPESAKSLWGPFSGAKQAPFIMSELLWRPAADKITTG